MRGKSKLEVAETLLPQLDVISEQSQYLIMSTHPRMEYVNESLVYRLPHGSNIDSDRVRLIL